MQGMLAINIVCIQIRQNSIFFSVLFSWMKIESSYYYEVCCVKYS